MVPRQKGETHAYACHMMVPVNLSYFSNTKVVLLEDFPRLAVTDIAGFFHVLSISRIGNSLQGSALYLAKFYGGYI